MAHRIRSPAPWETIRTDYPFATPWLKVRRDQVRTHLGDKITVSYQEHPGCALVVAVTHDDQVILVLHYRHPVRTWCWEVPGGRIDEGYDGRSVAELELQEEAGGRGGRWQRVGSFYTSTGSSSEQAEVYLAVDVEIGRNRPSGTELLQVGLFPRARALQMAREGEITDGPSALALLMSEPFLGSE